MRWGAVALAAGALAGLAGAALGVTRCGGEQPAQSIVRIHLEVAPPNLNPILASDVGAARVTLGDVYEPLWSDERADALTPVLAESWWRSGDDTDWIVTLRDGIVWHDGKPFGAADVVYTYTLLGPHGLSSPLAADFDDLVTVEARDPRTVRFHWKGFRVGRDRAVAKVPILPAHVFGATAPAEIAEHPASSAPVGTGPYRFSSWDSGRAIALTRVAPHRAPAAIERVVYRIIPDRGQAVAQLRAGQLDAMLQVPGSELEAFAGDPRFAVIPVELPSFTAVTWNAARPVVADPRVRRALTMLLDREAVVREIYQGRGRLLSGPWLPSAPAYDPAVVPWPFDVDAARGLLAEAGASGARVRLLVPQESRVLERIATVWQEDAKQAGLRVELETAPWGQVLARARSGDFDGVAFSWTTGPEQDFYHRFHSSQIGGDNWGRLSDPEVDRLLESIRTIDDRGRRIAAEQRLHRRLHELEPVTFVSADVRTAVVSKRLGGVDVRPDGVPARLLTIEAR
jgi:peptide/nickel transport system substrate-binding protein